MIAIQAVFAVLAVSGASLTRITPIEQGNWRL
jgi:hypothetical protein